MRQPMQRPNFKTVLRKIGGPGRQYDVLVLPTLEKVGKIYLSGDDWRHDAGRWVTKTAGFLTQKEAIDDLLLKTKGRDR